jgi:hypothetical protein
VVWDAEEVGENDTLRAACGARDLSAVAQHVASGHHLGLAIKLANPRWWRRAHPTCESS